MAESEEFETQPLEKTPTGNNKQARQGGSTMK